MQNNETKEKLLYATDTYYIKYKFKKLNYLLIECNYISEIAKENIQNNTINKSRYTRLLESHLSLENLINFLKANDLSNTKKIVICHLSDQNSNEQQMLESIYNVTRIETIAARPNMNIKLELYPF
ncbi:MAG: hypothetical protein HFJ30_07095 [Clostridia bacterium]|jgi:phosphoribosyl 1,2-cyclic phosphodiesterase|nr:hypothetical protein [Clostridia bacterium]